VKCKTGVRQSDRVSRVDLVCVSCAGDVRNIVCLLAADDDEDDDDEMKSSLSDDVIVVGRQLTTSPSPTRQVFDCSRLGLSVSLSVCLCVKVCFCVTLVWSLLSSAAAVVVRQLSAVCRHCCCPVYRSNENSVFEENPVLCK